MCIYLRKKTLSNNFEFQENLCLGVASFGVQTHHNIRHVILSELSVISAEVRFREIMFDVLQY